MSSLIIEHFDVEEQVSPRLVAGVVQVLIHHLAFQRTEKALHGCIIVQTANPFDANLHTVALQQNSIGTVGVLTALKRIPTRTTHW